MANYPLTQSGAEVQALLNKVQTPDTTPTTGSTNLVTSGGTKDALDQKAAKSDVDAIKEKIPSSASSSNKMTTQADIADFITRAVTDLVNYYTKSQTYTKTEVNNLIGALHQFHFEIYATLPASGDGSVLYLIGPTGTGSDKYEEYVWANNTFVKIGDTTLDLSGYVTTEALNTALADYTTTEALAELLANKANIDGYYETLAVGIAKNLEGRNDVTDSFMERTTGGDAEVANGAAQLTEVAGKSQVWNQLIPNISAENINLPGSSYVYDAFGTFPIVNGHKYFINVIATEPTFGLIGFIKRSNYSVNQQFSKVIKGIKTATKSIVNTAIWGSSETTGHCDATINIIDLTLLGIDNLTTVEEVEAWLAENIGLREYYPYNAGTVLNSKMQGIESLGFNLLDPTTGKARIVGAYSDVYGNYYGITGTHGTLTFTSDLGETSEITPDTDGKFLLEEPGWLDVAIPGADCAVFLWWDGTQTDYQPYERNTGDLDVTHIYGKKNGAGDLVKVWPTGMPGLGELRDKLYVENGAVVAKRVMGEVDLGTKTYTIMSGNRVYTTIGDGKTVANSAIGNGICSKYNVIAANTVYNGTTVGIALSSALGGGDMSIYDSAFDGKTAAQVKTALDGVKLYYELAAPETYTDLVYQGSSLFADGTPVEPPVNYRVNNWGIERMIPQNDSDVVTTFPELTCRYSIDAVEQLNTHTDEIEDLYEGLDELDAKKPNKSGSYPGMAVGSAKAIEGNDTKVEDFTFTPIQCADGLAQIKDVRGKSLVWNQLVQGGDFPDGATGWIGENMTLSISDNTLTGVIGSSPDKQVHIRRSMTVVAGNKYYVAANIKLSFNSTATKFRVDTLGTSFAISANTWTRKSDIIIGGSQNFVRLYPDYASTPAFSENDTIEVKNFICCDLTLMFGAGNEPTTVEEFEKMFPLPYYAYNAGAIKNNAATAIESVGFNQWDEEWELGGYDTGTGNKKASEDAIRSKNAIRVFPGTAYCFTKGATRMMRVLQYDSAGNYIGYLSPATAQVRHILTLADNAYTIKFYTAGNDYSNKVCINLSDPSRNGTYEPYKKDTVELNLPTLTGKLNGEGESVVVFPDGLKSAGTVYDEIIGNGAIKRTGEVDLGTLTWTYDSANTRFYSSVINGAKAPSYKILCAKYEGSTTATDKVLFIGNNGKAYVKDSAYTDAATFKTAMDGVLLYYELATPEEYILDAPIPDTFQAYKGGTLKQLPENTSTPTTAPMVMENVYAIDVLSVIQSLPQNYVSKESLQAMLASMQSAGLFSAYTMTWDETNQRYTFTFTANPTE